jgi:hypothetical protein
VQKNKRKRVASIIFLPANRLHTITGCDDDDNGGTSTDGQRKTYVLGHQRFGVSGDATFTELNDRRLKNNL